MNTEDAAKRERDKIKNSWFRKLCTDYTDDTEEDKNGDEEEKSKEEEETESNDYEGERDGVWLRESREKGGCEEVG